MGGRCFLGPDNRSPAGKFAGLGVWWLRIQSGRGCRPVDSRRLASGSSSHGSRPKQNQGGRCHRQRWQGGLDVKKLIGVSLVALLLLPLLAGPADAAWHGGGGAWRG